MVNQLGVPTFFLTLSCADLKWDELIENIQKLSKIDKTDIDMQNLSNHERYTILNNKTVIVPMHFQYKLEDFLDLLLLMGLFAYRNITPSE